MKRKTYDDQAQELEKLQKEAFDILHGLSEAAGQRALVLLLNRAKKVDNAVQERNRTDRCYYCHRTDDLGEESDTGLTQCFRCHRIRHNLELDAKQAFINHYHMYGLQ